MRTVDEMIVDMLEHNQSKDTLYRFLATLENESIIEIAAFFGYDIAWAKARGNVIETFVKAMREEIDCPAAATAPAKGKSVKETLIEFERKHPNIIFHRICEVRRAAGLPRDEFDRQLKELRDFEHVQLHQGDVTSMTDLDVEDCLIDENGYRMGTVTLFGEFKKAVRAA